MSHPTCGPLVSSILGCILLAACSVETPPLELAGVSNASLRQSNEEWLVINYWATWCKPCIEEVPELNAFMRKYQGQARVLAVNFDGLRGAELNEQAKRLGFRIPLLEDDPASHYGYPTPQVLPTTVIINPIGGVQQILIGPQTVDSLARSLGGANTLGRDRDG